METLECPNCGAPMKRSEFQRRPKGKFAEGARFQCKTETHSITVYVLTGSRAEAPKTASSRAQELLNRAERLSGKEAA